MTELREPGTSNGSRHHGHATGTGSKGTNGHAARRARFRCATASSALVRAYAWGVTFERITVDPDQMGGLRCIRGLRVTVSAGVGQLGAGRTIDDV